eukprot:CFRG1988T1
MKFSVITVVAACMAMSSYAMDPACSKVKVVGSIGPGCTSALLTADAPTNGECVAVSVGSIKVNMNGNKAVGGAYNTPDCSGEPLASVSTSLENTCVNSGIASFKVTCLATTPETDPETDPETSTETDPETSTETDPETEPTEPCTPDNEYLITCEEKAIRNPESLRGVSIDGSKQCCQWSKLCDDVRKCTKSYCRASSPEPEESAAWNSEFTVQV